MVKKINLPEITVFQRDADVISTLGVGDRRVTRDLRLLHVSHMSNNVVEREELSYSGAVAVWERKFVEIKMCAIQSLQTFNIFIWQRSTDFALHFGHNIGRRFR